MDEVTSGQDSLIVTLFCSVSIIPPWFSILMCHQGMTNMAIRSSRAQTQCHHSAVNNKITFGLREKLPSPQSIHG
jgi:hypothetical protein